MPYHATRRARVAVAVLVGALTGMPTVRTCAQDGPPPGPPPGEARPDTPAERGRNNAAKLAGLVEFVAQSCPDLRTDDARFRRAVAGMGVDVQDLRQGELKVRSAGYAQIYGRDAADSCKRAVALFGEGGRVVPGVIVAKDPAGAPRAAPQ